MLQTRTFTANRKTSIISSSGFFYLFATFFVCFLLLATQIASIFTQYTKILYGFTLLLLNTCLILLITAQKAGLTARITNLLLTIVASIVIIFFNFDINIFPLLLSLSLLLTFLVQIFFSFNKTNTTTLWSINNSVFTSIIILASYGWVILINESIPVICMIYIFLVFLSVTLIKILRFNTFLFIVVSFFWTFIIGLVLFAIIKPPFSIPHVILLLLLVFTLTILCELILQSSQLTSKNRSIMFRSISIGMTLPLIGGMPIALLMHFILYGTLLH